MNKTKLIAHVATRAGLSRAGARRALDAMQAIITRKLRQGRTVQVRGLGTFATARRPARMRRDPRTGEPVRTPAMRVLRFRPSGDLRHAADPTYRRRGERA